MIYSASRRTDLPAFYPDYIVGKVRRSRKLEGIVFWTKDIRNFVCHPGLKSVVLNVPSIIQFTLTGLAGSVWEPNVPGMKEQEEALRKLVTLLPSGVVRWRFDPIIADHTVRERFASVFKFLCDCGVEADEVTVSFPDAYRKVVGRLQRQRMCLPSLTLLEKKDLLRYFQAISKLKIRLCCESELAVEDYTVPAKCIDAGLFEKYYGVKLRKVIKDTHQRGGCGCDLSTDIGRYDMLCRHNCLYCYASPQL